MSEISTMEMMWLNEKQKNENANAKITALESRIQELEEARNKHWRGEEIAVRQLEIVKAELSESKGQGEIWKNAHAEEAKKFQAETLRASELFKDKEKFRESLQALRLENEKDGEWRRKFYDETVQLKSTLYQGQLLATQMIHYYKVNPHIVKDLPGFKEIAEFAESYCETLRTANPDKG